jgi:ribosomal protein S27AE
MGRRTARVLVAETFFPYDCKELESVSFSTAEEKSSRDADDERPPICPACGVTMGMIVHEDGKTRYVCLECGFSDEESARRE